MGATVTERGVRFVVFSRHATVVRLVLFGDAGGEPTHVIDLDPGLHRTGDLWHVEVDGLAAGQRYGFQAAGPFEPENGHRFHPGRLLLDPYARALDGSTPWDLQSAWVTVETRDRCSFTIPEPSLRSVPRCIVVGSRFDWGEDRSPAIPLADSIIYEMHVRGFTQHPSSDVAYPGTYQGVIERIPYLVDLGVTAIELLPVHEFHEGENQRRNPKTGERLKNYWGYSTLSYFSPKGSYAAAGAAGEQVDEFKTMVKALHAAGLEVILDVVFNHTAEGGAIGPTLFFKGLDNKIYYLLEEDGRTFRNDSGCGNTVNCNHPVVQQFILDCLHYWVAEMHVDGFRFDLATILARGVHGELLDHPPLVDRIAEDPLLQGTKIIAEPWDAGGAYQVGSFSTKRWAEWNGRYRDDVRRFWRGDPGLVSSLATRVAGSSDLYRPSGRRPYHSVNFITSHDGFTLRDLVSYARKHNEANGEKNRDGDAHEVSWNLGREGETDDATIHARRRRQIKSLLATLLLSQGVPMLLAGDEFYRTQGGNNNAYCQDNEVSWLDWNLRDSGVDIHRFVRGLIAFRKQHPGLRRSTFFNHADPRTGEPTEVTWWGPDGQPIRWTTAAHALGCLIDGRRDRTGADEDDDDLFVMFLNGTVPVDWVLPAAPSGSSWHRVIDTGRPSPHDWLEAGSEEALARGVPYRLGAGTVVALLAPRA